MGGELNDELIPEGLRDIYRRVCTSADHVEDERVRLALVAVVGAIMKDITGDETRVSDGSNVIQFTQPERRLGEPASAKSR